MGALIDSPSVQRFARFSGNGQKARRKDSAGGKKQKEKQGHYVTPGIYKMKFNKNSGLTTQESFTPQVIFYEVDSLDQGGGANQPFRLRPGLVPLYRKSSNQRRDLSPGKSGFNQLQSFQHRGERPSPLRRPGKIRK